MPSLMAVKAFNSNFLVARLKREKKQFFWSKNQKNVKKQRFWAKK